MQNEELKEQEAVNQIYDYAANLMVNEKKSNSETKQALIEEGIDEESAAVIVDNLITEIGEAKKEAANKDMLWGAVWCIGGIIVTAVTYSNASGGGTYVVAWGAILFGAIQFLKGLVNSSS